MGTSSRFASNSETNALELLENPEEMITAYKSYVCVSVCGYNDTNVIIYIYIVHVLIFKLLSLLKSMCIMYQHPRCMTRATLLDCILSTLVQVLVKVLC